MAENGVSSTEGKILGKLGRDLQFNLELDVSEALTGLKAVQREAKEAVKVLRELESMSGGTKPLSLKAQEDIHNGIENFNSMNPVKQFGIERFSREELVEELSKRTGVTPIHIEPNQKANLRIPSVKQSFEITGPSTIFITE